jgi:hypothetical protein
VEAHVCFVKSRFGTVLFLVIFGFGRITQACIWDSKTLWEEKREHPTLAQAILSAKQETPDIDELTNRIQRLQANPSTNDPAWWNDLAGAYLRLGQPAEAVKILEPITNKFSGDYGVHANLGTGYHLLGRYVDAEKEIRRDLEINPDAHFGLEKYHLALLQYLSSNANYRLRHLYVDEFSISFLATPSRAVSRSKSSQDLSKNVLTASERKELEDALKTSSPQSPSEKSFSNYRDALTELEMADEPPLYTLKWNLGEDPKLDDGVIYMATLNPNEPSCWVMLGMVATRHWDLNLAKTAFKKAIELGSPQAPILQWQIIRLNEFHPKIFGIPYTFRLPILAVLLVIAFYIFRIRQHLRRKRLNFMKA